VTAHIRQAAPADAAEITAMIHELADFEHAADQCTVVETQISTALFDNSATLRGHVAEVDGEIAAMALWFINFSTWDGVAGVYLEDLYVRPCLDNGYTRLSWAVLDWNVDAIALYDAIGGQPQGEWTTYRLSGPELAELAGPR
jgi:hypothetical protein